MGPFKIGRLRPDKVIFAIKLEYRKGRQEFKTLEFGQTGLSYKHQLDIIFLISFYGNLSFCFHPETQKYSTINKLKAVFYGYNAPNPSRAVPLCAGV